MTWSDEIIGNKYSKITVLEYAGRDKFKARIYKCLCECGNEFVTRGWEVFKGKTKSCGCTRKERLTNKRHGATSNGKKTREYQSWTAMKARCNNPNNIKYHNYGGRGITYQESWEDYENFLEDMGPRPEGMSLERLDSNGNYTKDNCVWATLSEQSYNTRKKKTNTSGRTGVYSYETKTGTKWHASITVNRQVFNLGRFDTFEEAVQAREAAEIEHHGKIKE